ncbi:MAG TPA: STAS domain-containing protein [Solirubrobacteraceae bacterium]|nr:STAS domain-containing protein [Solirubrobacteraceae bacterium]
MPVPQLNVTEEDVDDHTHILALRGELDVATVPRLADPLREAIAAGKTAVVIDLGELTFLDSTGLMVLLNGLRRVVRQGGNLVIMCTNPTVLRLFDITGTASTFTVVDSREKALAAATGGAGAAG